jgi:hypothetical protein
VDGFVAERKGAFRVDSRAVYERYGRARDESD